MILKNKKTRKRYRIRTLPIVVLGFSLVIFVVFAAVYYILLHLGNFTTIPVYK